MRKKSIIFLLLFIIVISSYAVSIYFIKHKLSFVASSIINKLSNKMAHTIEVKNIDVKLQGIDFIINLEKIFIINSNNITVFKADNVQAKFNLWDSIFNKTIKFADDIKITNGQVNQHSITCKVNYKLKNKKLDLNIKDIIYNNKNLFANPIKILNFNTAITWHKKEKKCFLKARELEIILPEAKIHANANINYENGIISLYKLHVNMVDTITATTAKKYLPVNALDPDLNTWLLDSIQNGDLLPSSFTMQQGFFNWHLPFKNVVLKYHTDWPALMELSGDLHLNNEQITIKSSGSKIASEDVNTLTANITGLNKKVIDPLVITGHINTSWDKGLDFLLTSPLKGVGDLLIPCDVKGPLNVNMQLSVPLMEANSEILQVNTKLQGKYSSLDISADIDDDLSNVAIKYGNIINTKLVFTNDQLKQKDLPVRFFVESLNLFNKSFKKIWVDYDLQSNEFILNHPEIKGIIVANKDNILKMNFDKLYINDNEQTNIQSRDLQLENLPIIIFECRDFILDHYTFDKVQFTLLPMPHGYDINDLVVDSTEFTLQGQGHWQTVDEQITFLTGNILSDNFGKTFNAWGLGNSIQNSKGSISFILDWNDIPLNFSLEKIKGEVNLELKLGQIIGVNPGIGRIISLLSLENIQRRLKLDFKDLTTEGFTFDLLKGKFDLNYGKILVDEILINGPSANINLNGEAFIATKKVNVKMTVVPKTSTTIPLVASIAAGNPAVGAAIWAIDKVTDSKINELTKHQYKVNGTWDHPEINEYNTDTK